MRRHDPILPDRPFRRPGAHRLRPLGGALLCLALLAAPAGAAPAMAAPLISVAHSADPASGTVTATVGVANDGVLLSGQDLQLSISVRNGTTTEIDGARVQVAIETDTLDSRPELQTWLDGTLDFDGSPIGEGADIRLLPSSSAQLGLTVPAAEIPFSTASWALGTHALTVTVTSPGGVVATARAAVELTDGAPVTRETGVSVLVPLTVPDTADGLLSADALQDYTRSSGTLSRQLDAVSGRAVAIGVDPRILASIRILGGSAPESARSWLDRLQAVPNELFPLPYADADVAAQAQSGLSTLLTPTSFEYGIDDSLFAAPASTAAPTDPAQAQPDRPTTASLVALDWSAALGNLAWPADRTVRAADLETYAASGMNRTVVSSANLALPETVSTATRTNVAGRDVIVADSTLSSELDAAASATGDSEWRASMTTISAVLARVQRDDETPDVVLALDRGSAINGTRLAQTLDAIESLPWAHGTTLSSALAAPATSGVTVVDSPESAQRLEHVSELLTAAAQVEAFSAVLTRPELLSGKRRNDLLALLAVTWQGDDSGWSDAVTTSRALADSTLSSVSIESSDSVLQLSHDSSIPVYVRNDLPWPVAVRIDASTSNAVLDIDEASIEPTSIDARSQGRVAIPVKARVGNGETDLRMQITALDGTPVGAVTSIRTSVRADWETVGTLAFGILLVLVFGVGILRNIRRKRRGEEVEEEDPNAPLAVQPALDERNPPRG
ncbi:MULTISPECIES: DUF6049 family protein [unclassified Rathayibacter]|uniref:DUF6049 family protein n=1 Tax=unclassified Rathayibacter TaxID=2609250 RepID=UPI001E297BFC|nr:MULTISPECIES: DUF6049 family protein [unclassified Rathayibacter]